MRFFTILSLICLSFIAGVESVPKPPGMHVAPPPPPKKTMVNLRVEGSTTTIFEGSVQAYGRNVTTASGGTHLCDGTNSGANAQPGATCTSALALAAIMKHFQWDGTYSTEFADYFVTSIGPDTQTSTKFWGILLNFQFTPVGGCQQEVQSGGDILWAYDAFNANAFLKLAGPTSARRNQAITVHVMDGQTGSAISGATVQGVTTATDGSATITLTRAGTYRLKAERSGSIRSNAISVVVR